MLLRPFREEDVEDYAAMCSDPEVMRFLGGKIWTRMDAWRHIAAVPWALADGRALTHAFEEMDRDHVISLIHPKNRPSRAVAERLGEQYVETIEFFGEQISVYGIWRKDWSGA